MAVDSETHEAYVIQLETKDGKLEKSFKIKDLHLPFAKITAVGYGFIKNKNNEFMFASESWEDEEKDETSHDTSIYKFYTDAANSKFQT